MGCDSTAYLDLTVNYSTTSSISTTACDSYTLNGQTYTTSGIYTQHLTNALGCDSTLTLNLIVNYSSSSSVSQISCDSYTLNGQTYTSSGVYTQNLTNSQGCDSTLTLNLTVNYSSASTTVLTVCDSVIWNGTTYATSGIYSYLTTNALGCDSTAYLDLTVNYSNHSSQSISVCDSIIWNGSTYTSSGTYVFNTTTVAGCDSSATLYLTVLSSSVNYLTVMPSCDSYSINGQTYITSGIYQQVLTNSVGCDSVLILDVTINYSTSSLETTVACDSYFWNGQTYTSSGVYNYLTTNSVGCDSTAYLDLTVNYSSTSSVNVTDCFNFFWNGTNYTSSGVYTYSTTNAVGCDSTATLNLTILDPFLPGVIFPDDILCKYDIPNTIIFSSNPSGGDGNYSYQWLTSLDGVNWSTVSGAISSSYSPSALLENTYYSVQVSNLCGVDTTNIVFDSILPSPEIIEIQGYSIFCANQHDNFFWILETLADVSYQWEVYGGTIFQQISDSAIAVDMDPIPGNVSIELLMTHDLTGCEVFVDKIVTTTNALSPNRTQVIRKPNSDILVCDDSSANLQYQWGYTQKSSGIDTDIPGANLRYVLLPHSFDSTTYRYWVRTWFDYGAGEVCETMSYLGPSPITNVFHFSYQNMFNPFPNPSTGLFTIPILEKSQVHLSNSLGQQLLIRLQTQGKSQLLDISHFPDGVYFLTISSEIGVYRYTLLKQ